MRDRLGDYANPHSLVGSVSYHENYTGHREVYSSVVGTIVEVTTPPLTATNCAAARGRAFLVYRSHRPWSFHLRAVLYSASRLQNGLRSQLSTVTMLDLCGDAGARSGPTSPSSSPSPMR